MYNNTSILHITCILKLYATNLVTSRLYFPGRIRNYFFIPSHNFSHEISITFLIKSYFCKMESLYLAVFTKMS